jgi:DNA-binding transcriptional regulator YhcF (GntR family)
MTEAKGQGPSRPGGTHDHRSRLKGGDSAGRRLERAQVIRDLRGTVAEHRRGDRLPSMAALGRGFATRVNAVERGLRRLAGEGFVEAVPVGGRRNWVVLVDPPDQTTIERILAAMRPVVTALDPGTPLEGEDVLARRLHATIGSVRWALGTLADEWRIEPAATAEAPQWLRATDQPDPRDVERAACELRELIDDLSPGAPIGTLVGLQQDLGVTAGTLALAFAVVAGEGLAESLGRGALKEWVRARGAASPTERARVGEAVRPLVVNFGARSATRGDQ